MTLLARPLEDLIKFRDTLYQTISNLEMSLLMEKKKIDEFEFYKYDKNFDMKAMEEQIIRSQKNVEEIEKVLRNEKEKLETTNKEIAEANKILTLHGTHPCLLGTVPHDWQVLSRHPSGNFSHRKCQVCGTSEKVGYT
jgi:predicted RNase H-like nuclease (RuvC/YqgF family)